MQEIYAIQQSREAKKEIEQIGQEAEHQYDEWKKTLSGTLTDKQLSTGLTLLFAFYVFYASFNSISGGNSHDEDLVHCTCSETHRAYYQTLVITFSSIWVICFCLIAMYDLIRFLHVKPSSGCFRWERMMDACVRRAEQEITSQNQEPIIEDPSALEIQNQEPVPEVPSSPRKQVRGTPITLPQVYKSNVLKSATLKRLDHYENYLWLQFNRVYSVGAALGKHSELKLPEIKSVVADEKKIQKMSLRKMPIQVNGRQVSSTTDDEDEPNDELFENMEEEDIVLRTADMACSSIAFFLYPLLLTARLAAQVSLIPLLILQVLDTHVWICIMKNMYCDNLQSEYELGLDRTAMSFGFYTSVLISILASTMLQWFPCSKKAKKSGAMSIA